MKILADENVHPVVVARLREAGFDLEWIAESSFGSTDEQILRRSDIAERILITYDRDFGGLIFRQGLPWPRAIIYSRLGRAEPRHLADRIITLLEKPLPDHHIFTIARDRVRSKPFPSGV